MSNHVVNSQKDLDTLMVLIDDVLKASGIDFEQRNAIGGELYEKIPRL